MLFLTIPPNSLAASTSDGTRTSSFTGLPCVCCLPLRSICSLGSLSGDDPDKEPSEQMERKGKQQTHGSPVKLDVRVPSLVEAAKELGGIVKNSMTVETAEAVTNKDGVRYGDI